MRVIIAGSRNIENYDLVKEAIVNSNFDITEVVSGKCPTGVDALGERWAKENNIPIKEFPADWKTHGRAGGPIRNSQMIEYSEAAIFCWNGESRGTLDTLKKAKEKGIKIFLMMVPKRSEDPS